MGFFKNQVKSVKLNLSSSFDRRTNNELVNVGGEGVSNQSLVMFNLENASNFYDGSLATRNGSVTLSNGLAGLDSGSEFLYDTIRTSTIGYGTHLPIANVETSNIDFPVQMYIPSGSHAMVSGTYFVRGISPTPPPVGGRKEMAFKTYLFDLNQSPLGASGASFMSGNGFIHNLAFGGNYNIPPFPEYVSQGNPMPSGAVPIAISESIIVFSGSGYALDTDASSLTFGQYITPPVPVPWEYSSPAYIYSGTAYAKRFFVENTLTTAGWNPPSFDILYHSNHSDIQPNVMMGQEFLYVGPPATQLYAIRKMGSAVSGSTTKQTIDEYQYGYVTPGFLDYDNKTSSKTLEVPIKNSTLGGWSSSYASQDPAPMGQLFTPLSGDSVYFGSYFYPSTFISPGEPIQPPFPGFWNTNGPTQSLNPYVGIKNIGVRTELIKVVSASGSIASGTYTPTSITSVAVGSGNIVLDMTNGYNITYTPPNNYEYIVANTEARATKPNYRQDRTYILYNNPVLINSSGTDQYINTFGFYDIATGAPSRTFMFHQAAPNPATRRVYSAFAMGVQENDLYAGGLLINYSGSQWGQFSGNTIYSPDVTNYDLNSGMIKLADQSSITLVYEYRLSDFNFSKVIYGHRDKLYWSTFANPAKTAWTVFHSGAAVDNNALWTAATMQNLGFFHQYGLSTGQVWDATYSGNSYEHGKRPLIAVSGVSVSGSASFLPSGTYQVMAAVSMESGGLRSSEISTINIASGQWINVNLGPSGVAGQYPFDLNPSGVYVFSTAASGSIFYAPTLYNQIVSGTTLAQPLSNSTSSIFINNVIAATDPTPPDILEPPYPQYYLATQITTPRFKKIMPFLGYMLGVGASGNTSSVFYSEINGPQIWGTAGDFNGSIDVNPEDGDEITSIERFKQYVIIFKRNSTYRLEFLEEGGLPFAILPIDNTLGALGVFSTVSTPEGVYGLSQQGPIICDAGVVKRIGQEIYPWYQGLDHNDLKYSYALHDQPNNTITWSIGNDDSNSSRNFGLIFNYRSGSWIIRRGSMWNCGNIVRDADNFDQIWIGDALGQVKRDGVTNVDSDVVFADGNGVVTTGLIQLVAETPWMSYEDSDIKKSYRFLVMNTESAPGTQLKIEVFLDYATVPSYTRTMNLDVATPINRVNLGDAGRIVRFKIYNVGNPNLVKINKLTLELQYLGTEKPASKFM